MSSLRVLPVILVCMFVAGLRAVWGQLAASGGMRFHTCLQGTLATHEYSLSLGGCVDECQRQTRCRSVNYAVRSQRCELNDGDETTGGTVAVCRGWVYLAMWSQLPSPHLGLCVAHTCTDRTRCRQVGSNGTTCEYAICEALAAPATGLLLGNRRQIGARVSVECGAGVALTGPRTATCQEVGKWSQLGECLVTCGLPPVVPGMEVWAGTIYTSMGMTMLGQHSDLSPVVGLDILPGSHLTYTCSGDSQMVGPNTTTCTNGSWTQTQTCHAGPTITMFAACKNDNDCLVMDSECRDEECWCQPGLSYSPSNNSCVTHCSVYGNTFQYVEKMVILFNDVQIYHTIENELKCHENCLNYTDCKSYETKAAWCALQTVVAFDDDVTFSTMQSRDYHQRDCAPDP